MVCRFAWGNTFATNVQCLVVLQNQGYYAEQTDKYAILYNLHILTLPELVKFQRVGIMFKAF